MAAAFRECEASHSTWGMRCLSAKAAEDAAHYPQPAQGGTRRLVAHAALSVNEPIRAERADWKEWALRAKRRFTPGAA